MFTINLTVKTSHFESQNYHWQWKLPLTVKISIDSENFHRWYFSLSVIFFTVSWYFSLSVEFFTVNCFFHCQKIDSENRIHHERILWEDIFYILLSIKKSNNSENFCSVLYQNVRTIVKCLNPWKIVLIISSYDFL